MRIDRLPWVWADSRLQYPLCRSRAKLVRFLRVLLLFILLLTSFGAGQSVAPVSLKAILSDYMEIMTFLSGSLTSEERQRLEDDLVRSVRRNPQEWYKSYPAMHHDVATLRENSPELSTEVFENWRRAIALNDAPEDPHRQIIEAHDPTVVVDRVHNRIITEQLLKSLRDAVAWTARRSGNPRPDEGFIARERAAIRQQYSGWPDNVQDAYAHIVENFPSAVDYIDYSMEPAKRDLLWTIWKKRPRTTTEVAVDLLQAYRRLFIRKMALIGFKRNMMVMNLMRSQQQQMHETCESEARAARQISLCP